MMADAGLRASVAPKSVVQTTLKTDSVIFFIWRHKWGACQCLTNVRTFGGTEIPGKQRADCRSRSAPALRRTQILRRRRILRARDPGAAGQHIIPLLHQPIEQVDKNPVFGQLVTLAPVNVDDAEFAVLIVARHAQHAATVFRRKIGPAKEPAIMPFGQPCHVAGARPIVKRRAERAGMLFGIALNRIGRTGASGPPPDHIVVPRAGEFLFKWQFALPCPQIGDHRFDCCLTRRMMRPCLITKRMI